jgi:uncharacterized protein
MDVEYDPVKDTLNIENHSVSLTFGKRVFDDPMVLIVPTIREQDGEERYKAIGMVEGKLWVAIHVYLKNVTRLISVRRSNAGEQRAYNSHSS